MIDRVLGVSAQTWPVLVFLLLVTVLADLCHRAGLFARLAGLAARAGGGRTGRLFALWCLLCVLTTWTLSLDTTVVMLTPTALVLARRLSLPAWPFAVATLWLANTASLALPVANLTNLLAVHDLGLSAAAYARTALLPQAAVLVVVGAWLAVRHRTALRTSYAVPPPDVGAPRTDVALVTSGVATLGLGVAVVVGVPAWVAAGVGVVAVRLALGGSGGRLLDLVRRAPWSAAAFALVLFWALAALSPWLEPPVGRLVAGGGGAGDLVRLAAGGVVAANLVDNLPGYLVLAAHADGVLRRTVLLVAVDAGPLVTPWASLATLLWLRALRADGTPARWRGLALEGAAVAVLAVGAGTLALATVHA